MRITIKTLICQDLGYCCEWFFFQHNRRTSLVADRLGVTQRAVQLHKAAARESACPHREGCMRERLKRR